MKKISVLLITLILIIDLGFGQNHMNTQSYERQLLYTTVRIISSKMINGKLEECTGTGFFFDFAEDISASRPYIITNKHVIENALMGGFVLTMMTKEGQPDTISKNILIPSFSYQWISHPDTSVDLCIMPLANLLNIADKQGINFYYRALDSNLIPTEEEWKNLGVIENIILIGYPVGLIDLKNNLPLFRTGTTSSPPSFNFNGKQEFVIDANCFPGSSGSPVILNPGFGGYINRDKIYLLGILFAGPTMKVNGEVKIDKIATTIKQRSETEIPINLGYVIKSTRIKEFRKIIK